jgi:hypothetical protein
MTGLLIRGAFSYLIANELHYYSIMGVTEHGRA